MSNGSINPQKRVLKFIAERGCVSRFKVILVNLFQCGYSEDIELLIMSVINRYGAYLSFRYLRSFGSWKLDGEICWEGNDDDFKYLFGDENL